MNDMDKAFEQYQANKDKPIHLLKHLLLWFIVAFVAVSMGRAVFHYALFEQVLTSQRLNQAFMLGLSSCLMAIWLGKIFVFDGKKTLLRCGNINKNDFREKNLKEHLKYN